MILFINIKYMPINDKVKDTINYFIMFSLMDTN